MGELSKFKITTIVFLCMFIFFVGAVYTNTREMAENQVDMSENDRNRQDFSQKIPQNNAREKLNALSLEVEALNQRLDSVESSSKKNTDKLNCNIRGILTQEGTLQELTPETAIYDARDNGSQIVLTCSF